MRPRSGRHRFLRAVAACAVLLLTTSGAAAAQDRDDDTEPSTVNLSLAPSPAEATVVPYRTPFQTSPLPEQTTQCVQRLPGSSPTVEAEPAAQQRMRVREAWEFATGEDQKVAVIDTGVSRHPRLAGRLIDGGDYVLGRSALDDCDGHGTIVAGIIAAAPDTHTGFAGVAPDAEILSIRQASSFFEVETLRPGVGEQTVHPGDTRSMAMAIVHAVELGATVINISEAACFEPQHDPPVRDLQAAARYAVEHNVVIVAAAGNLSGDCENQNEGGDINTISVPGWFDDDVLTVAATGPNDAVADFSLHSPWVDVAAPGQNVVSLDPVAGSTGLTNVIVEPEGEASAINGTSFSAPYVAGLVALVRERYPNLDARQVMHRITATAQRSTGQHGDDTATGYGMVDPIAALTSVLPEESGVTTAPPTNPPLTGVAFEPEPDPTPRTVALAGSGAGLGLLIMTLLIIVTVRYHRNQRARR